MRFRPERPQVQVGPAAWTCHPQFPKVVGAPGEDDPIPTYRQTVLDAPGEARDLTQDANASGENRVEGQSSHPPGSAMGGRAGRGP